MRCQNAKNLLRIPETVALKSKLCCQNQFRVCVLGGIERRFSIERVFILAFLKLSDWNELAAII